ncbi:MotA/TolQ/ExbB proton channel family protein [Ruegeria sp. Ofav3-42]|uniref:MotA/TolQ/ExbB proton channel family protein n=1 Tax=Ruegeria sp. Ofav3-42 TaxID=2917759 RepID=UPI001EF56301|nr:MotA/TolQ/ExbB proton channel family protein [Ruegeria sp. Ofav3-42]MCG7521546.1 MotA/TolQ/ExbB proton channel family protein [Ruegeria sp. Ofav3-42]
METNSIILAVFLTIPVAGFAQNATPPTAPEFPESPQPAPALEADPQTPAEGVAPDFTTDAPTADPLAPASTLEFEGAEPTALAHSAELAKPQEADLWLTAQNASGKATEFLKNGGPSIWAIAALSVITLALILWKIWRLALIGAWSRGKAGQAIAKFEAGDAEAALSTVNGRKGIRSKVVAHAIRSIRHMPEERSREETARVAKREIAQASTGLRALELIATIAPLLGLLGTVLGMIAAFQALQQAGNRADPALLAGGIWEALLTTAAGMAVAIPASAALTWFEAVIDRIRQDVEDGATRLFVAPQPEEIRLVAE